MSMLLKAANAALVSSEVQTDEEYTLTFCEYAEKVLGISNPKNIPRDKMSELGDKWVQYTLGQKLYRPTLSDKRKLELIEKCVGIDISYDNSPKRPIWLVLNGIDYGCFINDRWSDGYEHHADTPGNFYDWLLGVVKTQSDWTVGEFLKIYQFYCNDCGIDSFSHFSSLCNKSVPLLKFIEIGLDSLTVRNLCNSMYLREWCDEYVNYIVPLKGNLYNLIKLRELKGNLDGIRVDTTDEELQQLLKSYKGS